jgi:hypothetical protein
MEVLVEPSKEMKNLGSSCRRYQFPCMFHVFIGTPISTMKTSSANNLGIDAIVLKI